ncbi:DUF521 domain-containing protein [Motiliproteus coralliicola]|uniref:DUF521 domain-containing protein n=1 Tax=Motiliproteus coralliicola TaxID=2283196 RepID=A0A369WYR0_9GAMM|nr:aconitase X [Motiliproteus coralliicola]RDE24645.1 DUF521 domain-containing protein [Motiliproteus coralliicola]
MKLTDLQQQMLEGQQGECRAWAMRFLVETGQALGADQLTPIRYAFLMADTDAMGEAGINFLEQLAETEPKQRRPRASLFLESRQTSSELLKLGLPAWFMALDQRRMAAIRRLGCNMDYSHVNNHSVPAPCFGESIAMGSTPSAIYANSALGARTNFEAGPAGLAAAIAGFVPRWGLHLELNRRPQRVFEIRWTPKSLAEWGALGALIGQQLDSGEQIPLIRGVSQHPGALALSHLGASMAGHGAVGMFHIEGVTPEAERHDHQTLPVQLLESSAVEQLLSTESIRDEALDLVVIGAPQMSWEELLYLEHLLHGKTISSSVTMLAFVDHGTLEAARVMGVDKRLRQSGCQLLDGIDYFQSGSEPIRRQNGWHVALAPSLKLSNILNGAGYRAASADLENCVNSAVAGRVL